MPVRTMRMIMLGGVCALSLSGCGWFPEWEKDWPPQDPAAQSRPVTPAPKIMQTGDATWIEPSSMNQTSEVATGSVDQRLRALERSVADIRNDLNMMMPALTKLVAVQGDLQEILNRMQGHSATLGTVSGSGAGGLSAGGLSGGASASPQPLYLVEPSAGGDMEAPVLRGRPADNAALSQQSAWNDPTVDDATRPGEIFAQTPPPTFNTAARPVTPVMRDAMERSDDIVDGVRTTTFRAPEPLMDLAAPASSHQVNQLRFGQYDGKTRLVLDVDGEVPFSYAVDRDRNLLALLLPGTHWVPQAQAALDTNLVHGYRAEPDGEGGTRILFALQPGADVHWADHLPPAEDRGHRLVIDIDVI